PALVLVTHAARRALVSRLARLAESSRLDADGLRLDVVGANEARTASSARAGLAQSGVNIALPRCARCFQRITARERSVAGITRTDVRRALARAGIAATKPGPTLARVPRALGVACAAQR